MVVPDDGGSVGELPVFGSAERYLIAGAGLSPGPTSPVPTVWRGRHDAYPAFFAPGSEAAGGWRDIMLKFTRTLQHALHRSRCPTGC